MWCVSGTRAPHGAHTHTECEALLCSDRADVLAGPPIFLTRFVVIGRRALLVLLRPAWCWREVRGRLAADRHRVGHSASDLATEPRTGCAWLQRGSGLQLTEMATSESFVAATLALGNVVPMTEESAETYRHP